MAEDPGTRRLRALERENAELREFVSIVSHDLFESVRKVQIFGERLSDRCAGALDEAGRKDLQRVVRSADRLSLQIDGLLEYSRVSSRGGRFVPIELASVLGEVLASLADPIARAGACVEWASSATFKADRAQIAQIFGHLIGNSLKFRKEGVSPLVKVLAFDEDPDVRIEVRDNGIGFDPRFAEQIFKVFTRLHPASQYEGVGVGLAICRRILERHGGEITARGEPGAGSVFSIRLPKSPVEDVSTHIGQHGTLESA